MQWAALEYVRGASLAVIWISVRISRLRWKLPVLCTLKVKLFPKEGQYRYMKNSTWILSQRHSPMLPANLKKNSNFNPLFGLLSLTHFWNHPLRGSEHAWKFWAYPIYHSPWSLQLTDTLRLPAWGRTAVKPPLASTLPKAGVSWYFFDPIGSDSQILCFRKACLAVVALLAFFTPFRRLNWKTTLKFDPQKVLLWWTKIAKLWYGLAYKAFCQPSENFCEKFLTTPFNPICKTLHFFQQSCQFLHLFIFKSTLFFWSLLRSEMAGG